VRLRTRAASSLFNVARCPPRRLPVRFMATKDGKEHEQREEPPRGGKLRELWTKYGAVGIGTYAGVYVGTLATLYVAIDTGYLVAVDAVALARYLHLDTFMDFSNVNPKASNFTLAWLLTKIIEPLRLGVTIAITPAIARKLGRA